MGCMTSGMSKSAINLKSVAAVAARLKASRLALGLNQTEFCKGAGIATNTYNQVETGRGRPSLETAMAICDAFGLTLDWIYRGDPSGLPYKIARIAVEGSQSASSK